MWRKGERGKERLVTGNKRYLKKKEREDGGRNKRTIRD